MKNALDLPWHELESNPLDLSSDYIDIVLDEILVVIIDTHIVTIPRGETITLSREKGPARDAILHLEWEEELKGISRTHRFYYSYLLDEGDLP